ncbi:MAG: transporter [Planctomycetota bacterium]|jgi:hypothetical protein
MEKGALLSLSALFILTSCEGVDMTPVAPPPMRSKDSTDTDVRPEKGDFEIEVGVEADPSDTFDSPYELRLGIAELTEVFVAGSMYQWESRSGPNANSFGDTVVGLRNQFFSETDSTPAVLFELASKLPTADESEGLGSGEVDFGGAVAISKTFDGTFLNASYGLTLLGDPDGDDGDLEHSFGILAARFLGEEDEFFVFGEVYTSIVAAENDEQVIANFGTGWFIKEDVILDFGFDLPLSNDAPDFSMTTGITVTF